MKERVKFGCRIFLSAHEPFQNIIQRAQFCEKQGFDSVLIDDHLLYGTGDAAAPEPFTILAAIATGTRRIRVGIAVTDMVRRHPAIIAQTLATLSNQFPRRVFLGLGAGDPMNQTPFGFSAEHRVGRLEEGLKIIRQLWNSSIEKPQNYKGQFFSLNNAYLQAGQEKQPVPSIYLAAFGPRMLRLAGEAGDGWIPHCHTPSTYKMDLDTIIGSAHNAGRDFGAFRSSYYTLSSISKNRAEADRNVDRSQRKPSGTDLGEDSISKGAERDNPEDRRGNSRVRRLQHRDPRNGRGLHRTDRGLSEGWLQRVHADLCPERRTLVLRKSTVPDTTLLQQGAQILIRLYRKIKHG